MAFFDAGPSTMASFSSASRRKDSYSAVSCGDSSTSSTISVRDGNSDSTCVFVRRKMKGAIKRRSRKRAPAAARLS